MGIQVEFNPDLALRNISEYKKGKRKKEECIPRKLEVGKIYAFLKQGQRNYWFDGEFPLLETKGGGKLSRPKASIILLEATHIKINKIVYTKGNYKVTQIFNDDDIHFEGYTKINHQSSK